MLTRRGFTALLAGGARQYPGERWEERDPAWLGLGVEPLEQLARDLGGRGCVVKDGFVVLRWGNQAERGDWLSSAKPVFTTLLLFAVAEGKLAAAEATIERYGWRLRAKDRRIRFLDLANMTSGYARPEAPGKAWAYNDYAIQLYQRTLFERVFEEEPERVAMASQRLGALGFEDGLRFTEGRRRLVASVRDFARIAWFWLNDGRWQGRELLPRRLFRSYHRPMVPRNLPHTAQAKTDDYLGIGTFGGESDHFTHYGAGIYGGNWWFNRRGRLHPQTVTWPDAPADTFMSIGFGGNCSVTIPSLGLVLVSARGNWGSLAAGEAAAPMNQRIRLLVQAARRAGGKA
jgi:CubicO group peptidase (beta-lactamase class C family)